MAHHHHHLLPLTLALLLLIIFPSSSRAEVTPALFSDANQLLFGGESLSYGDLTLSLSKDCGLILYKDGISITDFNTATTTSDCLLYLSRLGQFVLNPSNTTAGSQIIFEAGELGHYALLFVENTLGIYGPSYWNNGVFIGDTSPKTSDNFIVTDQIVTGSDVAQNGDFKAGIDACTFAVTNNQTNEIIWVRPESEETSNDHRFCFLSLTNDGELLLQNLIREIVWHSGSADPNPDHKFHVGLLRSYGSINTYGLHNLLYGVTPNAAAATKNIKMVTTA